MTNLIYSWLFAIQLTWNPNMDSGLTEGYKVYHGSSYVIDARPKYTEIIDVGCNEECFINVPANQYDWFVVTAYGAYGQESDFSLPVFVIFPR